jgi:hypothetical protein
MLLLDRYDLPDRPIRLSVVITLIFLSSLIVVIHLISVSTGRVLNSMT